MSAPPQLLGAEVEALAERARDRKPLVVLDEVQRVPELVNSVQDLVDRRLARFVLTGSSARKLRRGPGFNLLPGRLLPLETVEIVDFPFFSLIVLVHLLLLQCMAKRSQRV